MECSECVGVELVFLMVPEPLKKRIKDIKDCISNLLSRPHFFGFKRKDADCLGIMFQAPLDSIEGILEIIFAEFEFIVSKRTDTGPRIHFDLVAI